jgi:hypothetical protein
LHVGYGEIGARLVDVVRFIESAATPTEIVEVLANRPVVKLTQASPALLVTTSPSSKPSSKWAETCGSAL